MKRGVPSSILFAISAVVAAALSAKILGPGFWGMLMLGAAVLVGLGPWFKPIRELARVVALTAGAMSLLVVPLGLLAATVGGSFRLPQDQAFMLAAFGGMGIFGIACFVRLGSK